MRTHELEIADWAKAEQRQKIRAEWIAGFFGHVRVVFILLFIATILVFATNRQVEVQQFFSTKVNQVAKKLPGSDHLRENALKHEKEIDAINQQSSPQFQAATPPAM